MIAQQVSFLEKLKFIKTHHETTANMSNQNLLLSDYAKISTKPYLKSTMMMLNVLIVQLLEILMMTKSSILNPEV